MEKIDILCKIQVSTWQIQSSKLQALDRFELCHSYVQASCQLSKAIEEDWIKNSLGMGAKMMDSKDSFWLMPKRSVITCKLYYKRWKTMHEQK